MRASSPNTSFHPSAPEPFGVELLADALSFFGDVPIAVTEGALDCLARRKLARDRSEPVVVLGVPSSTSVRAEWSELFEGREVRVSFDADAAGDRGAERFADVCLGTARSIQRERPHAKDWGEMLLAWDEHP